MKGRRYELRLALLLPVQELLQARDGWRGRRRGGARHLPVPSCRRRKRAAERKPGAFDALVQTAAHPAIVGVGLGHSAGH